MILTLWLGQVALFAAGLLGPWRNAPEARAAGRLPRPVRLALSLSLVLAAVLVWTAHPVPGTPGYVYASWILLGMACGSVGDFIMARVIPVPDRLVGGMLAFGLGHVFYIVGCLRTVGASGVPFRTDALVTALAVYGALTAVGWWAAIRNPDRPAAVNYGALGYGALIGLMAAVAFTLAVSVGGGFWLAAVGAASFVASDMLIGVTDIRGWRFDYANDWIWLTYLAAQMGIVYAGVWAV